MNKKKFKCENCNSSEYKNKITTFPITFPGKQINVQKVAVRECIKCGIITPTEKGNQKLRQCSEAFISIMLK